MMTTKHGFSIKSVFTEILPTLNVPLYVKMSSTTQLPVQVDCGGCRLRPGPGGAGSQEGGHGPWPRGRVLCLAGAQTYSLSQTFTIFPVHLNDFLRTPTLHDLDISFSTGLEGSKHVLPSPPGGSTGLNSCQTWPDQYYANIELTHSLTQYIVTSDRKSEQPLKVDGQEPRNNLTIVLINQNHHVFLL